MALAETESELEQKLLKLRERVAFYGSTRTYQRVFEVHGQEELGRKLHEMSVTNRWSEMADAVSLAVVRDFAMTGTYETMPDEIERRQAFADRVSIDASNDPAKDDKLKSLISRVQKI